MRHRRVKRVAVSEVFGSLIMVAITLVAGAAVFGFVNGQAAVSENQYGQAVATGMNHIDESFTVVTNQYSCQSGSLSPCSTASFWLYNTGSVALTISSITFVTPSPNSCSSPANAAFADFVFSGFTPSSAPTSVSYKAYDCSGLAVSGCSGTVTVNASPTKIPIPSQNSVSAGEYSIGLPNCTSAGYDIKNGETYQLSLLGAYGTIVSMYVTPES